MMLFYTFLHVHGYLRKTYIKEYNIYIGMIIIYGRLLMLLLLL